VLWPEENKAVCLPALNSVKCMCYGRRRPEKSVKRNRKSHGSEHEEMLILLLWGSKVRAPSCLAQRLLPYIMILLSAIIIPSHFDTPPVTLTLSPVIAPSPSMASPPSHLSDNAMLLWMWFGTLACAFIFIEKLLSRSDHLAQLPIRYCQYCKKCEHEWPRDVVHSNTAGIGEEGALPGVDSVDDKVQQSET
jgi:hypothetical protein